LTGSTGFVGLDLGTSSLKGVVVGPDGTVLAHARASYPTRRPRPGHAEQDPADWDRAVAAVVASLRAQWPGTLLALGLSGMIPTLVTLDVDLAPVGPAITWEDTRAEREGAALRDGIGAETLYRTTGQWLDGRYLVPMHHWLRAHDPDRAGATRWLASAKDHLFHSLTGELATDPSTAAGFGPLALASLAWDRGLCQALGVTPGHPRPAAPALPEVRPTDDARPLSRAAARRLGLEAGLAVVLGAADSVAGALGLGAEQPGAIAHLAGTSTVILGIASEPRFDPAHRWLVTPLAGGPGWGLEMDLLATGSALAWLADLLRLPGRSGSAVLELAAEAEAGAAGVVFLPYLAFGEQGALWDPALRGAVGGLNLASGPPELARALVEGILVETRRCTDLLRGRGAGGLGPVHAGGWGAHHTCFRQWLADATGRPVLTPDARDSGDEAHVGLASAVGAARLAARSVGAPLPDTTVRPPLWTHPGDVGRDLWSRIAERHERWRRQTHPHRPGRGPTA